jgi:phage/plasmid-like protein (TIGR03299 family)
MSTDTETPTVVSPEGTRAFYPATQQVRAQKLDAVLKQAGIDWQVGTKPIYDKNSDKPLKSVRGELARIVRLDTDEVFGVVSGRYKHIQTDAMLAICDDIAEESGAVFVAGGPAKKGLFVWVQMKMQKELTINGDPIAPYITVVASHSGDRAAKAMCTFQRVACTNQLPFMFKDATRAVRIIHTGDTEGKLAEARLIMQQFDHYRDTFAYVANQLSLVKVSKQQLFSWVDKLWSNKGDRKVTDAKAHIHHLVNEAPNLEGFHGTTYAWINAVAEYVDWGTGREKDRMARVCADKDARLKTQALRMAMEKAHLN